MIEGAGPTMRGKSGERGGKPMPDDTSGAWDLIAVPWHLDEHIPDFPVPADTVATINPPLPDGAAPSRVTVPPVPRWATSRAA